MAAMVAMGFASFCNDLVMPGSWGACMDVGGKYAGTLSGTMNMLGNLGGAVSPTAIGFHSSLDAQQLGRDLLRLGRGLFLRQLLLAADGSGDTDRRGGTSVMIHQFITADWPAVTAAARVLLPTFTE